MYIQRGHQYFLANKYLENYRLPHPENVFGVYLGREKNNEFFPSFALLGILAQISCEKVIVSELGELDFLYGKNLKQKHIIKILGKKEDGCLKLVQNIHDENLGYGKLIQDSKSHSQVLKHILDRGIFLKLDRHPEL
ncbi:MAG: hypothetical protein QXX20_04490 [Candidatus Thermoplasmatota archaeon]